MRRSLENVSSEERRASRMWSVGVFVVYGFLLSVVVGMAQFVSPAPAGSRDVVKAQIDGTIGGE